MSGASLAKPVPADFLTVCMTLGSNKIAKHYNVGSSTAIRWLGTLPPDVAAERAVTMKALTFKGSSKGGKKPRRRRPVKAVVPMPDDFPARYVTCRSVKLLAIEMNVPRKWVEQWSKQIPADAAAKRAKHQFEFRRGVFAAARAARVKSVSEKLKVERQPKPKVFRRQSKPSAATFIGLTPGAAAGVASRAAEHLKRVTAYKPICDASKVYGKTLDGVYLVGQRRMPVADMIALAVTKGFDADAWKRLAA